MNINESYIFSKDNLYINFDKFESGECNVCLITGLSGSGKSTLGKSISNKYNAEYIELDLFECCYIFENDKQLKQAGDVFYEYFSKHRKLYERLKKKEIYDKELMNEISKFLKYVLSYCKRNKNKKFVVEGVQIYSFGDKSFKKYPLILVNTSVLKSMIRMLKRNQNGNIKAIFKEIKNNLPEILKWYIEDEKAFRSFKKAILKEGGRMNFETLNTNQEVTIHKDKKPNIIKECNTLKELNASYINYIMQPYEEQVKADEQCIIEYGITNRERYKELYEELSSRIYINNNLSESVSTEFEPDYVNTIHNTSFIDRLNDLPYFTPIDMSELGVYSKSNTNYYGEPSDNENNDLDWYKSYELLQYGVVPENFKELNNRRVNKLNELSKDFKHHKQTVLELGWNPEVPFTVENRIKATENTRYKLTKNLYKNEFYDATEMVDESYLMSGKDIYVEFDKFESGENNVCLITGLAGSGKTTLAKQLASKYNATVVSLDNFSGIKKTGDELKEIDPVLYSYLSTRKSLWENLVNKKLKGNNLTYEGDKYLQYVISYCKKDKKNKYIIEGVQIYWLMNGGELNGCSLICVNTSALKSAIRRVKRVDKINRSEKVRLIDRIVDAIDCAKIDKDAERGYNDFKKEVKDSLNEIAIPDKNPIYVILVYTASPFGKIIKQYTHGIYTHAALSLDSTLDRLYSFNLNNNFSKLGGFSIESIKGYLHDNKDAVMCVYTTFINDENKRKLKKQLDYFVNNVDKTKYSVFNIFTMLVNKPVELANDMICSQFVDRMLKMVDVDITGMASALVTPNDLYKSTSTKIYKVFEGRLDKYNKKKTDKIVSKLSLSNLTEKESPIQFDNEGNLIIVKDIKDIETEYNKSHKLLMNYDRSGNYDAMKPELCKLWYLNNKLEYMIFKSKKHNKEYYDMRARILNDFNKYLTIVNKNDPSYSFSNDYDKSKYSDSSFKISKHTLKHGIDYTKRLLKP